MAVKTKDFGKDHWSLLAFIECLCVDGREGLGEIDFARIRINRESKTHCPLPCNARCYIGEWNSEHGTRLDGYWKKDGKINKKRLLPQHDDWDCLEDFEAEGLVEILSSVNGFVKMTEKGVEIAAALRKHKVDGGSFADFAAVYQGLKLVG